MKKPLAVCALLMLSLPLIPALPQYLERSDALSLADRNMESLNLLTEMLPTVKSDQERAEIYWRLSRDTIIDTDNRRYAGESIETLLSLYEKGESYADQSIALDPNNLKGYYLKACNIGRRENARGTLASLSQADLMRRLLVKVAQAEPQAAGPWYVLSQLYAQAPGWPVSFGNPVWAVSLGRKALDAESDAPLDYSIQLARHLLKRDWSSAKRAQEQANEARMFHAASDPVERYFYYEGIAQIPPISDRAEALQLCQFVIAQLQGLASLTPSQNADLTNAQECIGVYSGNWRKP